MAHAGCSPLPGCPTLSSGGPGNAGETLVSSLPPYLAHAKQAKQVIIVGAGIIGAACAYYLTLSGARVTVVERTGVACAASGKAGSFLAKDWGRGPVADLAMASFDLHKHLAAALGADAVGYRTVDTVSVSTKAKGTGAKRRRCDSATSAPSWVGDAGSDVRVSGSGVLGSVQTTAQVTPGALTRALLGAAQAAGAQLVLGEVCGVQSKEGSHTSVSVTVSGRSAPLDADAVVLALGPWAATANEWLPGCIPEECSGEKVHSIEVGPHEACQASSASPIPATALFVHDGVAGLEPEVYPRPDGTVYCCGISSDAPLPGSAEAVVPCEGATDRLCAFLSGLSTATRDMQVLRRNACYLPTSPDGVPIIGASSEYPGVFLACGHYCWGILYAPATGRLVADLVLERDCTWLPRETLGALSPERFVKDLSGLAASPDSSAGAAGVGTGGAGAAQGQ